MTHHASLKRLSTQGRRSNLARATSRPSKLGHSGRKVRRRTLRDATREQSSASASHSTQDNRARTTSITVRVRGHTSVSLGCRGLLSSGTEQVIVKLSSKAAVDLETTNSTCSACGSARRRGKQQSQRTGTRNATEATQQDHANADDMRHVLTTMHADRIQVPTVLATRRRER